MCPKSTSHYLLLEGFMSGGASCPPCEAVAIERLLEVLADELIQILLLNWAEIVIFPPNNAIVLV